MPVRPCFILGLRKHSLYSVLGRRYWKEQRSPSARLQILTLLLTSSVISGKCALLCASVSSSVA